MAPARRASVVAVDGLEVDLDGRQVLSEVSFTLADGVCYGLVGPNGTGKTTTLRALLGLVRPTRGSVRLWGHRYADLPAAGHRVGASLDVRAVPPAVPVRSWLCHRARLLGLDVDRVDGAVADAGLAGLRDRPCGALSTGELQRLSIAGAVLSRPELLVLDEPTLGLDIDGLAWLRSVTDAVVARGGTVLMSSHALDELARTASHVLVMDAGTLVADAPLEVVLGSALRVRASEPRALLTAVLDLGLDHEAQADGAVLVTGCDAQWLGACLYDRQVRLSELARVGDLGAGVSRLRARPRQVQLS